MRAILANPRYTGRQVWNRQRRDEVLVDVDDVGLGHETKMRWNDGDAWVWSEKPAHEALVSTETFEAVDSLGRRPVPAGVRHRHHPRGRLCRAVPREADVGPARRHLPGHLGPRAHRHRPHQDRLIPRWLDCPPDLAAHLIGVAQIELAPYAKSPISWGRRPSTVVVLLEGNLVLGLRDRRRRARGRRRRAGRLRAQAGPRVTAGPTRGRPPSSAASSTSGPARVRSRSPDQVAATFVGYEKQGAMRQNHRIGGIAALVAAGTFVFGFVMAVTTLSEYAIDEPEPAEAVAFVADNQAALYIWHSVILILFGWRCTTSTTHSS